MTALADELRPTAANGYAISSNFAAIIGQPLTVSFEYFPTGLDNITIWIGGFSANRSGVQLNIAAGTIADYVLGTGVAPTHKSVTNMGAGWRRVVFTALAQQTPSETTAFRNLSPSVNANGINGIRIRRLQVGSGSGQWI
jgi:hypothetical protein